MATPNVAGFRAAQARLHEHFGTDVAFLVPPDPAAITWPANTAFDPETGLPLDPVIEAVEGGDVAEVTIKAQIVHRSSDPEVTATALGWVEGADMALIISPEDKASVEDATEVRVYGERQRISSFRPDGIQNSIDRWVVFLEGM